MDGLECNEIFLSQVLKYEPFRIDSHFYEKQYMELNNILSHFKCIYLKELVQKTIQTGHTPSMAVDSYYGGNIALIKTDNLHDNSIGTIFTDFLTEEGNAVISRTALSARDIITTIIGATESIIARSAIITEEYLPANINQNIVQIRINPNKVSPEYTNIFLNTKYGKKYLVYLSRQTEQFNLNCKEIESVPIPILSCSFQHEIEKIVLLAQKKQSESRAKYKEAEKMLGALNEFQNCRDTQPVIAIKQFSDSLIKNNRIDAEFYHPKYNIFEKMKNYEWKYLKELADIDNGDFIEEEKYGNTGIAYIRGSDIVNEIIDVNSAIKVNIPVQDYKFIDNNDIAFSMIGSVGTVSINLDSNCILSNNLGSIKPFDKAMSLYLLVYLKSKMGQLLFEKYKTRTAQPKIRKEDVESFIIPILDKNTITSISTKVQESFVLLRKSKEIFEYAKQAIEMAIERDENTALEWLKRSMVL